MPDHRYTRLVEAAAERLLDEGALDMVDIVKAVQAGYDARTFTNDVTDTAAKLSASLFD